MLLACTLSAPCGPRYRRTAALSAVATSAQVRVDVAVDLVVRVAGDIVGRVDVAAEVGEVVAIWHL